MKYASSRAHKIAGTGWVRDQIANRTTAAKRPRNGRVLLAVASLTSGAALLTTIVTRASLGVTLAALVGLMGAIATLRVSQLTSPARRVALHSAAIGLLAGASGTLAYDLVRLTVVAALGLHLNPFGTWPIFGQLIIGGDVGPTQWVVGAGYHYINGLMFAVAYCLLLPGRNWKYGVIWALALESLTLAFYPGWLHLHDIVLQEFTVVSIVGHLAYGSTIGVVGQRFLGGR